MIIGLGDGGVTLCPAWGLPAAPPPSALPYPPPLCQDGSRRRGRAGNQRVNQRGTSRLW